MEIIIAVSVLVLIFSGILLWIEVTEKKHFCKEVGKITKYDLLVHKGYHVIGYKCSACGKALNTNQGE